MHLATPNPHFGLFLLYTDKVVASIAYAENMLKTEFNSELTVPDCAPQPLFVKWSFALRHVFAAADNGTVRIHHHLTILCYFSV